MTTDNKEKKQPFMHILPSNEIDDTTAIIGNRAAFVKLRDTISSILYDDTLCRLCETCKNEYLRMLELFCNDGKPHCIVVALTHDMSDVPPRIKL